MPKANAEVSRDLARLSSDCSFLLTHLVRQNNGLNDSAARKILHSILNVDRKPPKPLLRASTVGWYSVASPKVFDPETYEFDGPIDSYAVCFTESTLAGLKAHRDVFHAQYGISFDRDFLFKRGANPCLNIRESLLKAKIKLAEERYPPSVYNFIPTLLQPYVNIIHESFDATHEREWRYPGDFQFKYRDVFFVFCPKRDFPTFSVIQSQGRPVLFDLTWLDRV
jgi:hypothetical protein